MTAPLTPHGNSSSDPDPGPGPTPGTPPAGHDLGDRPAGLSEETRTELRQAAVILAVVTVSGVLLGLLWLWLAPRVPLVSDGKAVYLKNTEGEQAIGADGWFALLGLAFGAVFAALVFLFHRKGGIAIVVGLAAGSLLASVIGWRVGVWLGPTPDVAAHARAVGKGVVFEAPLKLAAKGMLLAFPLAAMAVHLGLTALFGPRDPEPSHPEFRQWGEPAPGSGGAER
ncbi:ABC transporter permease [Streptomyces sp. NPDC053048]|uniref:ABC transporter permease n=1 Tax=Streptomyces sp. NPDC053048 TaxID=3365694 RepID=UPI0037D60C9E